MNSQDRAIARRTRNRILNAVALALVAVWLVALACGAFTTGQPASNRTAPRVTTCQRSSSPNPAHVIGNGDYAPFTACRYSTSNIGG